MHNQETQTQRYTWFSLRYGYIRKDYRFSLFGKLKLYEETLQTLSPSGFHSLFHASLSQYKHIETEQEREIISMHSLAIGWPNPALDSVPNTRVVGSWVHGYSQWGLSLKNGGKIKH